MTETTAEKVLKELESFELLNKCIVDTRRTILPCIAEHTDAQDAKIAELETKVRARETELEGTSKMRDFAYTRVETVIQKNTTLWEALRSANELLLYGQELESGKKSTHQEKVEKIKQLRNVLEATKEGG